MKSGRPRGVKGVRVVIDRVSKKSSRSADAPQYRRFFDLRPIHQHRCGFGVLRHRLRHDHLAAAALVLEARRDIHSGPEIVEHIARRDCDAGSRVKSELQHDWRRARASASGCIEACDIVLNCERRADPMVGMGEGGHERIAHSLDDEAVIALHPVRQEREMVANEVVGRREASCAFWRTATGSTIVYCDLLVSLSPSWDWKLRRLSTRRRAHEI